MKRDAHFAGLSYQPTDLAFAGLAVALIAVSSWITVPIGPVPVTLQTMLLVILTLALPRRISALSICVYLILGAVGLPVFAGMRGGLAALAGPTGGFLLGFVVAVLTGGFVRSRSASFVNSLIVALVVMLLPYVFGLPWFMLSAGLPLDSAISKALLPFVFPDLLKVVAGLGIGMSLKKLLPQVAPSLSRF